MAARRPCKSRPGWEAAPERGEQRARTSSSDWMSHKIQKRQSKIAVRGTSASDPAQAASPSHYLHEQAAVSSSFTELLSHPPPLLPSSTSPKDPLSFHPYLPLDRDTGITGSDIFPVLPVETRNLMTKIRGQRCTFITYSIPHAPPANTPEKRQSSGADATFHPVMMT